MSPPMTASDKLRSLADDIEHYNEMLDGEDRASWLRCCAVELAVIVRDLAPPPPLPPRSARRWRLRRRWCRT